MSANNISKKKVLIFSPTSFWVCHMVFERLVARQIIDKNHDVKIVYCDSILDICDVRKQCTLCRISQMRFDKEFDIQAEPMGKFANWEKISPEIKKIDEATNQKLQNYIYEDLNLSQMIKSSFYSYFRISHFDPDDKKQKDAYIKFLKSAVITANVMKQLISEYSPDTLLVFNARYAPQQVAFEMARKSGIEVFCHELGSQTESMMLLKDEIIHGFEKILGEWEKVKDIPLNEETVVRTVKMLSEWSIAKGRAGKTFIDPNTFIFPLEDLQKKMKGYRKKILFMTSSVDEIAALDQYGQIFDSQNQWLDASIDYLEKNTDVFGVIRFHPNTINKTGKIRETFEYIEKLRSRKLPSNVQVIYPQEKVNTYKLMRLSDAGVTYGTTASLEMTLTGKKVLISRKCPLYYLDFFMKVSDIEHYHRQMDELLDQRFTIEDYKGALRFFHYYVKGTSLPFHYIKFINDETSFLNFLNYDEIKDSKALNVLSNFVITGKLDDIDAWKGSAEEETRAVQQIHLINKAKSKKVMILSDMVEEDFWKKDNPQYDLYRKSILQYGNIPELIFYQDQRSLKERYAAEGGFTGFLSPIYKLYYRTLFRIPYMIGVHKLIRKMYFGFLKKMYSQDKTIRMFMEKFSPDYTVCFSNGEAKITRGSGWVGRRHH